MMKHGEELVTVEIVEIGPKDAFYEEREHLVGAVGKWREDGTREDGYVHGTLEVESFPDDYYNGLGSFVKSLPLVQCKYKLCEPDV